MQPCPDSERKPICYLRGRAEAHIETCAIVTLFGIGYRLLSTSAYNHSCFQSSHMTMTVASATATVRVNRLADARCVDNMLSTRIRVNMQGLHCTYCHHSFPSHPYVSVSVHLVLCLSSNAVGKHQRTMM